MAHIDRRPIRRPPRRRRLLVALLLAAGFGVVAPARAALVLSVPAGIPATAGATDDHFDVSLTVTGTVQVGAFQFSLDLPGASGVTFSSADTRSPNYLFQDSSGIGWTLASNSLTITAGDLELSPPGYVALSDTTVSLGRVYLRVDATARGGVVPVTFDAGSTQTLVLDGAGSPLDYSAQSGSIVVAARTVPEPATCTLTIVAALVLGGYGLHRRGENRCRSSFPTQRGSRRCPPPFARSGRGPVPACHQSRPSESVPRGLAGGRQPPVRRSGGARTDRGLTLPARPRTRLPGQILSRLRP